VVSNMVIAGPIRIDGVDFLNSIFWLFTLDSPSTEHLKLIGTFCFFGIV
jgi:hypothetical protein